MKKIRSAAFGSKKRTTISVVAVIALIATASALAWLINASGSGDAAGKGARSSDYSVNVTLNVSPAATPADSDTSRALKPTGTGYAYVTIANPASDPVTINTIAKAAAAYVVGLPGCAIDSHLTVNAPLAKVDQGGPVGSGPALVGFTIPGGNNLLAEIPVSADAGLPSCIASQEYRVPVSVTGSGG